MVENTTPIILKRDGTQTQYSKIKIFKAIMEAGKHTVDAKGSIGEITDIVNKVDAKIKNLNASEITIEQIQSFVEDELMDFNHDIARTYIEYRKQRDVARESQSSLTKKIQGLMQQTDSDILNENANKDSKIIPTQRDLLAGIVAKHTALTQILPKDVADAHTSGDMHYHDLDYSPFFSMFNCCLIDIKNMFSEGFKMGNAEIEEPKSIATATAVVAQIIAQVASHIYGGNTINAIDEVLAPYVTASYNKHLAIAEEWNITNQESYAMLQTEKECQQSFQGLEYEINTLHCANGQTPFTTLSFGLGTSWQEKLIQKSILQIRIAGLGKEKRTAVFPKLVFSIKKGINFAPTDCNYDIKQLALECSSKRMYPDILNYDKIVEVTGSFKPPMGCRAFLDRWENEKGEEVHDGRNNLGIISLNLPRIGIEANGSKDKFFEILNTKLQVLFKGLKTRIASLDGVKAEVAPILFCEGALGVRLKPDDYIADVFKNGRATISLGYIGLHELAIAMFGEKVHVYDSLEKQEFLLSVMDKLHSTAAQWKKETGYGFSVYSTPSESLCNRFCALDLKKFGEIKGVTDKGYYTNSFHLDVEKKVNPYEKITFEEQFVPFASAGFICYGEYPNMKKNLKALEDVWDYSYDHVPYYATNTPIDMCYECGYAGEFVASAEGYTCPKCGNNDGTKMNVIRRVCGYLGEPDNRPFIEGKQEEVMRRVKHL